MINGKKNEKLQFEEKLYSITIEKGLEEFLNYRKKSVQHSTFYREKNNFIQINKFLKDKKILIVKDITEEIFKQYVSFLENHNLKPKSINNYLSNLSNVVKYFKDKNYISLLVNIDLSKYWKKRKIEKIQIINKNEARIIVEEIKKIDNFELRLFLLIPYFTGLRFSEVKGINRKNIDLKNRFIIVCEKWTKATDYPETILKSKAGYRKVPLMDEFFPILNESLLR